MTLGCVLIFKSKLDSCPMAESPSYIIVTFEAYFYEKFPPFLAVVAPDYILSDAIITVSGVFSNRVMRFL